MMLNTCVCVVGADSKTELDFAPYLKPLYSCTLLRLKATDIDQEVKERAISCMYGSQSLTFCQ